MKASAVRSILLVCVLALVGLHACGEQVTGGDSESHFLGTCARGCGGGLVCICGLCTRACDDASGCGGVSRRAECTASSDSSCGARVCDVACISDDACKSFGARYGCIGGRCRDTAPSSEPDGSATGGEVGRFDGGGGRSGGSSGSGGAGPASTSGLHDASTCTHATYPPPPSSKNAGGSLEIVVAQSDVDFGDSPPSTTEAPTRFRNIGFDLDGQCIANELKTVSCAVSLSYVEVPDGPGGIDNAYGQFVQMNRNLLTNFSSEIYSSQLHKGNPGLLIHITGYNGQVDDDQVRVELMSAAPFDAFSSGAVPAWNGSDVFPVDANAVNDGSLSKPKIFDPAAYVTNGKLVAVLGDAMIPLHFGFTDTFDVRQDLNLSAAFLVCDLGATDVGPWGFALSACTLAGRWRADDLVHQLWHYPDPLDLKNPAPLCMTSTSYPGLKNLVCNLRDIAASGSASGPNVCDALSFGMNFHALPARLGDIFSSTSFSPTCPPQADPSRDSCDGPIGDQ